MQRSTLRLCLFILCIPLFVTTLYTFTGGPKTLELQCKASEIILPDGRIIKDYIAATDNQVFISSDLMEDILGKQIYWDDTCDTLYIDTVPTASVMSDKIKVYHYHYDSVHAFLYCPDAKANKEMTMAGQSHNCGYYFSNVFSASFNLEGAYHQIDGFLGCEDFKASDGQVDFYLDDVLIKSCTLKANCLPEKISLPVTNGSKLTLVFSDFKPDTQIDFADVYIQ